MQIDFHHAVTYILARLAGIQHPDARIIAHSAQYVDDATCDGPVIFSNHEPFQRIASAHPYAPKEAEHFNDILQNANNASNAETWALFHFLPGNVGKPQGDGQELEMIERFISTTDSYVAAAMCKACCEAEGKPNSLHRLGITAHVYADTWAHKHFVGLLHPKNEIKTINLGESSDHESMKKAVSQLGSAFPLGHIKVLDLPDLPFLKWSFIDCDDNPDVRDNTENFLQACERIVEFFGYYQHIGALAIGQRDKEALTAGLQSIQSAEGGDRHQAWLDRLSQDTFSFGHLTAQELADLAYTAKGPGSWKFEALGTTKVGDEDGPFVWTPEFETSNWRLFHQGLLDHRELLLNGVFKDFGLSIEKLPWRWMDL